MSLVEPLLSHAARHFDQAPAVFQRVEDVTRNGAFADVVSHLRQHRPSLRELIDESLVHGPDHLPVEVVVVVFDPSLLLFALHTLVFGFGHAIEAATDFAIPHGIAVSIGCDMANYCAFRLGVSTEQIWESMSPTFKANYQGYEKKEIPFEPFISALGKDKKNVGKDSFSLILPDQKAKIFKDYYSNNPTLRGIFKDFLTGLKN